MELFLSAHRYYISESDLNYAILRAKFVGLAESAKHQFSEIYLPSVASLDELVHGWSAYCNAIIDQAVDSAFDFLAEHGIYDIGKSTFLAFLREYDHSEEAVLQLAKHLEDLHVERAERESGRISDQSPGFIGGGLGLEGAAQGIAIASVANLALSAVKGLGHAASSANSSREAMLRQSLILSSDDTKDSLSTTIYELVFSTHYAVIDVLVSATSISSNFSRPSRDMAERAEAVLENCKKGRIPEGSQENLLAAALFRSPYTEGIYEFWLRQFGDANGELAKVYETYHLARIEPLKEYILGQKIPSPEDVANAYECDLATQLLDDTCSFLDLSKDNEYVKRLRIRFKSKKQELCASARAKQALGRATESKQSLSSTKTKDDWLRGQTTFEGSPRLKHGVALTEHVEAFFNYLLFDLEAMMRLDWRIIQRGMYVDYDFAIDDMLEVALASVSSLGYKLNTSASSYCETGASSTSVIKIATIKPKKADLTIQCIPDGKTRITVKFSWWQGKVWEAVVHGRLKREIAARNLKKT